MKQNITVEQLNELSAKGKEKLRKWCEEKDYGDYIRSNGPNTRELELPLLSIGQMIEFLDEHKRKLRVSAVFQSWELGKSGGGGDVNPCDALWEACKETLK